MVIAMNITMMIIIVMAMNHGMIRPCGVTNRLWAARMDRHSFCNVLALLGCRVGNAHQVLPTMLGNSRR